MKKTNKVLPTSGTDYLNQTLRPGDFIVYTHGGRHHHIGAYFVTGFTPKKINIVPFYAVCNKSTTIHNVDEGSCIKINMSNKDFEDLCIRYSVTQQDVKNYLFHQHGIDVEV